MSLYTEAEMIKIQNAMNHKITLSNTVDLSLVKYVAGVDLAYWKKGITEYAVCCIVIIDYHSHEIIETAEYMSTVSYPYIPGCLAFREIPLFLNTNEKLKNNVDLYFFDGNGYLHPRHMGLATHAGIIIEKPTIGVAKSYYKIGNAEYNMPNDTDFSYTDIIINGEVYGRTLRTKKGVKPIFISIGNGIDLNTTTEAVIKMITNESHIPLPTRLADIMTHKMRKIYMSQIL